MGSRVNLTSLLDSPAAAAADEPPTVHQSSQDVPDPAPRPGDGGPNTPSIEQRPAAPRYLQLERKETRLEVGQLDELTLLARKLNKRRRGAGERITENTLIRVAVDVLLQHVDDLNGATEAELRKSVGL
ncbi:hypothetical protein [uncultured Cellulomonas sp.]|uniref:hypothetical protein n=1 Tax=uncultured Cellulomonas sp. TaxID=189682 RepID=UPI0026309D1A|nr:hypothetical protein [uncultured Cellulomonas sp.]